MKNSQDLKTRIALLALEELVDRVADALAGRADEDALTDFADAYRDYAREHPGRDAAARLRLDSETAAACVGVRHAQMTRAIPRGCDLTEADQTRPVRMLGSVFHGYVSLELAGGPRAQRPRHAGVLGLDRGLPRRSTAKPDHTLTRRPHRWSGPPCRAPAHPNIPEILINRLRQ